MSKLRNIMYPGSSGSVLNVNKNSPGNGNGKWQGLPPNVGIRSGLIPYINTRARGDRRNHVFCINQLGGVGPKSNMFATTADGVQDCKPHPRIIPSVLIPKLVKLYCGPNDETSINMPPIYDDPTPPLDVFGFYVGIRNWFRRAQQIPGYGPQNGQFIICTSSDTKGLINAGESAFENMPAQLQKRMPNEDISNHFRSADNIVANIRYKNTYYSTVKNYLTMDNWFKTVPNSANPFGKPDSAITVLWWSFYAHWDPANRGYPIAGFTPGIDKTGFKLCWISNEALEALTCTAFTPILPVYQNPSRIELCPPSSSSNCITEPQAMGNLQPKDLASLKIDRTPIYLSA